MDQLTFTGLILIGIIYVYFAIVLMYIALKTNTPDIWMAWIPVAQLYLMTQIAQVPWWTIIIVIAVTFIPNVGEILAFGITIWWWWKICEATNKPGWWGLLMLIPIVNFVIPGILAWGKK